MSTKAGSGHPTSSLSAVELLTSLFFNGYFHYDVKNPGYKNNDRFILSKGHASPLFYALWTVAGELTEKELEGYRKFDSNLEGHPTRRFKHTEVTTGSLGQGLSVGVGMAINGKYLDKLPYITYVLLGDGEMVEGSNWEAIQLASYYKLDNLVGIIDVNRMGQLGETMLGHNLDGYEKRLGSFGWDTYIIPDGHDLEEINKAFDWASKRKDGKPKMIIAKTTKGKGVSFLENKNGWHGKVLSESECDKALKKLGEVDRNVRAKIAKPKYDQGVDKRLKTLKNQKKNTKAGIEDMDIDCEKPIATRKAYGQALVKIYPEHPEMVVLDAEVSNSTYSEAFKNNYPERFFEMFIAEQNMVGVALGLGLRGQLPFVSTFASFLTRATDQIRASQYSQVDLNFVASHCGVTMGEDGAVGMGLEDMAIFRTILGSAVLYPSDYLSCEKLLYEMAKTSGICYMRTTRMDTPIIYKADEKFSVGGSKTLKTSKKDQITVVAAGATLHESLKAYETLKKEGIYVRVIDAYSIKPIDEKTMKKAAKETKAIVTVEDHYSEGGLGDAVLEALADTPVCVYKMAVTKMPRSGNSRELLQYEGISADAISKKVKSILGNR